MFWTFRVSKPLSMGSFLIERIFRWPLTEFWRHILSGCQVCDWEAFSLTCAVHIDDCEGWWLSGCCSSVAEHRQLKPEVSWVQLLATAGFFTFLYFRLITSEFLYFQRGTRCSRTVALFLSILPHAGNEETFVFEVKEKKAKSWQSPGIEQSSDVTYWVAARCWDWTISVPPVYEEECEADCPLIVRWL